MCYNAYVYDMRLIFNLLEKTFNKEKTMKKVLAVVLCLVLALTCTCALVACNPDSTDPSDPTDPGKPSDPTPNPTPDSHEHSFAQAWTSDETNHWHVALCCDTDEVRGKAAHTPNAYNRCTVCGYQGTITYSSVSEETWATEFSNIEEIRNFTAKSEMYYGGQVMSGYMEVMENAVHQSMNQQGMTMDSYSLYSDKGVTEYVALGDFWTLEFNEGQSFEDDILEMLDNQVSGIAQMLSASFNAENFHSGGTYSWTEQQDGATIEYDVRFVGNSIYSFTVKTTMSASTMSAEDGGEADDMYMIVSVDGINNTVFDFAPTHTHEFKAIWSTSDVYHWHEAACHDAIDGKIPHSFGADNKCEVCGYAEPSATNNVVDEETFRNALQFKGLTNWTMTQAYGDMSMCIKRDGYRVEVIMETDGESYFYEILADGSTWGYLLIDSAYEKLEMDSESANELKYELALMPMIFSVFANVWNQLGEPVDGVYTIIGGTVDGTGFENATITFKFNDGEIVSINAAEIEDGEAVATLSFVAGQTTIAIPEAKIHSHTWSDWKRYEENHFRKCLTCGAGEHGDHDYTAFNSLCSACGAKKHNHTYTQYIPSYNRVDYHIESCTCGVIGWNEQIHQFDENDVCVVCKATRHVHDIEEWHDLNDEMHWGRCSECGEFDSQHEWDTDYVTCIVCGFVRHLHEVSEYDQNHHWGICTAENCPSGGQIYNQPHIWGANNGNCISCGAAYHEHVWTNGARKSTMTHEAVCSECGYADSIFHNFVNGTCDFCGVKDHEHTASTYRRDGTEYHEAFCSCGAFIKQNEHDLSSGKCPQCGYEPMPINENDWQQAFEELLEQENFTFATDNETTKFTEDKYHYVWDGDEAQERWIVDSDGDVSIYEKTAGEWSRIVNPEDFLNHQDFAGYRREVLEGLLWRFDSLLYNYESVDYNSERRECTYVDHNRTLTLRFDENFNIIYLQCVETFEEVSSTFTLTDFGTTELEFDESIVQQ